MAVTLRRSIPLEDRPVLHVLQQRPVALFVRRLGFDDELVGSGHLGEPFLTRHLREPRIQERPLLVLAIGRRLEMIASLTQATVTAPHEPLALPPKAWNPAKSVAWAGTREAQETATAPGQVIDGAGLTNPKSRVVSVTPAAKVSWGAATVPPSPPVWTPWFWLSEAPVVEPARGALAGGVGITRNP